MTDQQEEPTATWVPVWDEDLVHQPPAATPSATATSPPGAPGGPRTEDRAAPEGGHGSNGARAHDDEAPPSPAPTAGSADEGAAPDTAVGVPLADLTGTEAVAPVEPTALAAGPGANATDAPPAPSESNGHDDLRETLASLYGAIDSSGATHATVAVAAPATHVEPTGAAGPAGAATDTIPDPGPTGATGSAGTATGTGTDTDTDSDSAGTGTDPEPTVAGEAPANRLEWGDITPAATTTATVAAPERVGAVDLDALGHIGNEERGAQPTSASRPAAPVEAERPQRTLLGRVRSFVVLLIVIGLSGAALAAAVGLALAGLGLALNRAAGG